VLVFDARRGWVGECIATVSDVGWKSVREKNIDSEREKDRRREREKEKWKKNYSVRSLHKAHLLRDV